MCSGYPDDEEISQLMSAKRRPWSGRGEQQMPEQMLQATKWWDRQPWMLTHHQLGSDQGEVTHGKKQQHGTAALYASCNRCMALTFWLWDTRGGESIIFTSFSLLSRLLSTFLKGDVNLSQSHSGGLKVHLLCFLQFAVFWYNRRCSAFPWAACQVINTVRFPFFGTQTRRDSCCLCQFQTNWADDVQWLKAKA